MRISDWSSDVCSSDLDGFDRGWLAKSAELGWFSMLVPEADGGGSVSDNPLADAALVAEELGRQVQPGPFVPMNVALAALARHGEPSRKAELLPAAVEIGTASCRDRVCQYV